MNSWISELFRYQKSRIPLASFTALAVFLCVAGATGRWPTSTNWLLDLLLAFSLIVQFRVWDDLADLTIDRTTAPERVLCQSNALGKFKGLAALLLLLTAGLLATHKTHTSLAVFLLLNLMFAAWYRIRQRCRVNPLLSTSMVLIKYPVFVFLLGSSPDGVRQQALIYGMTTSFLCFCVYEVLHDRRLRELAYASQALAGELIALSLVAGLMLLDVCSQGFFPCTAQMAFSLLGIFTFVRLFQLVRSSTPPGAWCFGVFYVCFAWLLNYALAGSTSASTQP